MLLTELLVMKHQKASGRQRVCYGLFCVAVFSWWAANNFATCPQRQALWTVVPFPRAARLYHALLWTVSCVE